MLGPRSSVFGKWWRRSWKAVHTIGFGWNRRSGRRKIVHMLWRSGQVIFMFSFSLVIFFILFLFCIFMRLLQLFMRIYLLEIIGRGRPAVCIHPCATTLWDLHCRDRQRTDSICYREMLETIIGQKCALKHNRVVLFRQMTAGNIYTWEHGSWTKFINMKYIYSKWLRLVGCVSSASFVLIC